MKRILLVALLLTFGVPVFAEDDLTVLKTDADGIAPGKLLEVYLKQQFYKHLDDRRAAYDKIDGPTACRTWQKQRHEFFVQQLGGFPERTPLNSKTVGRLDGKGYRVENVIFESRPDHHVTANLYSIEKLILTPEHGVPMPALAFIPTKPSGTACLYLHGESMKADAAPGGPIEALVKQGQIVLAAELRGIGETETGHDKRDYGRGRFGRDVQEIFLAYLIGRSYIGMRTEDIAAWTQFLSAFHTQGDRPNQIHLVAVGEAALPALHAAALQPKQYASVRLRNMIRSWADVVQTPDNFNQAANVVHGALKHYDLPNLIDLVGAEKISVEESADVLGQTVSREK